MVLYQEYKFSGGAFREDSGSHIPAALTFDVDDSGRYTLIEYWEPRDGSGYVPDIREKFPLAIVDNALDTQKYILLQIQACYAQAVEYGNVDTNPVIAQLFETILSSLAEASYPGAYKEAHPVEYRELLYFGDYTLHYVFSEFLKGGQTGLKGHLLRMVLDDLALDVMEE